MYEQYDQEVPESDKDTKQLSNLFSYVVVVVRSWMNALYFSSTLISSVPRALRAARSFAVRVIGMMFAWK